MYPLSHTCICILVGRFLAYENIYWVKIPCDTRCIQPDCLRLSASVHPSVRPSVCPMVRLCHQVYKLCFPGELKPELVILQFGRQERKLEKDVPVSVSEINKRDVTITCEFVGAGITKKSLYVSRYRVY